MYRPQPDPTIAKDPLMLRYCLLVATFSILATNASGNTLYDQHSKKGSDYYQETQYEKAIAEFKIAYSLKQEAKLLYFIARSYHKLGQKNEAVIYYKRYTVAEPDLNEKAASYAYLDELGSADREINGRPSARVRSVGATVAGSIMLGLSYPSAIAIGSVGMAGVGVNAEVDKDPMHNTAYGMLIIPGVGPLLSGLIVRTNQWSIPLIALNMPLQIIGMALLGYGGQTPNNANRSASACITPVFGTQDVGILASGRF